MPSLGCFIDNPGLAPSSDGGPDASLDVDAGPSICARNGGYDAVQSIVTSLSATLEADCRVSPFFTALTPSQKLHLGDCFVKQLAVLTKCPGIRYDVDSTGEPCRDMKAAHAGLGIHEDDFDAVVDDLMGVLASSGLAQADIDALTPAIMSVEYDIVTNSAPGAARSVCDGGGGS